MNLTITIGEYWLYEEKLVKIKIASDEIAEVEFIASGESEVVETWKLKAIQLTDELFYVLGFSLRCNDMFGLGEIWIQRYLDGYLWGDLKVQYLNQLVWIANLEDTELNYKRMEEYYEKDKNGKN